MSNIENLVINKPFDLPLEISPTVIPNYRSIFLEKIELYRQHNAIEIKDLPNEIPAIYVCSMCVRGLIDTFGFLHRMLHTTQTMKILSKIYTGDKISAVAISTLNKIRSSYRFTKFVINVTNQNKEKLLLVHCDLLIQNDE